MKKCLSLLLAVMMLTGLVSLPALAEDVPTITMIMSGDNSPTDNNTVIQELNRRLGVNLEITYVSANDYNTKLNALIDAKALPDIYSVSDASILRQLKDAGMLYNFEPILEEYGPAILAGNGDVLRNPLLNRDGLYLLVSEAGMYEKGLAIRKDWLQKVGLDMPTDIDSLYEVMRAFTFDDPDGDGESNTYGFVANMADGKASMWQKIMVVFDIPMRFTNGAVLPEDGTVTSVIKHPRFLEAMEFLHKLYAEGILYPDFASVTQMQCFEMLWQGRVGMLGFQAVGVTNNWYPGRYTFDVPEDPGGIFGFAFINGKGAVREYPDYSVGTVINAQCEHPELALKVLDYMYYTEEGQELTFLGVEGTHFQWIDKENGKYERLGIYTDDTTHRADGAYVYNWAGGWTPENISTRLMNKTTQEATVAERAAATDYPYISTVLESRSEYGSTLDEIVKECFATLIVTTGDMEAEYQEFVTRWEEEGGLEYEAEATAAYAAEHAQ